MLQDIVRQLCVSETEEILATTAGRPRPGTRAFESRRDAMSLRIPPLCWPYVDRTEWRQEDHIAVILEKVDVVENASTA